jgi:hypothetical protein
VVIKLSAIQFFSVGKIAIASGRTHFL